MDKIIYCSVCDSWLMECNVNRHLQSHLHREKKEKRLRKSIGECQSIIHSGTTNAQIKTPEKSSNQQYNHFEITGNTLRKCPHEHKSVLMEGCSYFADRTSCIEELPDAYEVAKQRLFEKECEQVHKYDNELGVPQSLDYDFDWMDEIIDSADSAGNNTEPDNVSNRIEPDSASNHIEPGRTSTNIEPDSTNNHTELESVSNTTESHSANNYKTSFISELTNCDYPTECIEELLTQSDNTQRNNTSEPTCDEEHFNQIGYLKCSICNPLYYKDWEEY
ncbi:MAG: hypothetical protein ABW168_13160 [Sedimenticola sp.]